MLSSSKSLYIYYAHGELANLAAYERVVLQPDHYGAGELETLREAGTQAFAYLSLGEDFSAELKPWHRQRSNPDWQTRYVYVTHPDWQKQILQRAREALDKGFAGLFLDTLEVVELFPEERAALLSLVERLRHIAPKLIVNRGFALLPELAPLVDALVFEGFSTRWLPGGGYAKLHTHELEWTSLKLRELKALGVKVYALDYADTPALRSFARRRAYRCGLECQVSTRALDII